MRYTQVPVPWHDARDGRRYVLPPDRDEAIVLQDAAVLVWELVQTPRAAEQIVDEIGDVDGLDRAGLLTAVTAHLRSLREWGLIRDEPSA
ncbi:hypothetical protein HDA30_000164 [Micrococcus cohnii]|uniref:PqqD family protein n=1 Tax=Micrococcus cohnii TaxID=993416 RepID=A0A7W7M1Y8_9MICC|nr:PqqD family protein [Micrococcus cohnii]MBB4734656.1 hypothetical protein [Micrococcus cohnii]